jgi:hypothetical protein
VQLFEALDRVLPTEDADISKVAERGFKKQGIDVHTGVLVGDVVSGETSVTFKYGDATGEADYVVIAAGRGPDVEALGLEAAGVKLTERGLIEVDGALRTSVPGVYAIGDLVPGPALAHKAMEEGIIAIEDAAGLPTHPIAYGDIPRATFCTPNVASFGLTEAQAKEQGYDVVVGKVPYGAVGAGTVYGDRTGQVKIIGDKQYGELLGAHIVGAKATDLIQELVNTKALEGGYPEVARIIHGHPTMSEALNEAVPDAEFTMVVAMSAACGAAASAGVPVTAVILSAVARALRAVPRLNAAYRDGRFELYSRVNLGVTIAAEGVYVVPTMFDSDAKSPTELAAELADLGARARRDALESAELTGATFTFTDLAPEGLSSGAPLILGGQAGGLSAGTIRTVPVIRDGELVAAQELILTLAVDHRIAQFPEAGRFLRHVRDTLEAM